MIKKELSSRSSPVRVKQLSSLQGFLLPEDFSAIALESKRSLSDDSCHSQITVDRESCTQRHHSIRRNNRSALEIEVWYDVAKDFR
jgi:hypothetical protein